MSRHVRDYTTRRIQSGVGLLALGVLGAWAGQLVVAQHAAACSCAEPQWGVELVSVTSSDASVDHRAFWPADAVLSSFKNYAQIWADVHEPGRVASAGASPW